MKATGDSSSINSHTKQFINLDLFFNRKIAHRGWELTYWSQSILSIPMNWYLLQACFSGITWPSAANSVSYADARMCST